MVMVSTYVFLQTKCKGPGDQREMQSFIHIRVVCRLNDATAGKEVKVLERLCP